MQASLDCFSSTDWETVTVAKIAATVGIAKGTMYLHFASKYEIYARLTLNFYHSLLELLTNRDLSNHGDPITNMAERAFNFYLDKPKYRCVAQYCEREDFQARLGTALAAEFDAIDQSFHQLVTDALRDGMACGRYKSLNIQETAIGLQCTFRGALSALWCNRNGEQQHHVRFINQITRYMVAPLLADSSCDNRIFSSRQPAACRQIPELSNE